MMMKEVMTLERLHEIIRDFSKDSGAKVELSKVTQEILSDINREITGGKDLAAGEKWDGGGGAEDVAEVIWTNLVENDLAQEDEMDDFIEFFDEMHA